MESGLRRYGEELTEEEDVAYFLPGGILEDEADGPDDIDHMFGSAAGPVPRNPWNNGIELIPNSPQHSLNDRNQDWLMLAQSGILNRANQVGVDLSGIGVLQGQSSPHTVDEQHIVVPPPGFSPAASDTSNFQLPTKEEDYPRDAYSDEDIQRAQAYYMDRPGQADVALRSDGSPELRTSIADHLEPQPDESTDPLQQPKLGGESTDHLERQTWIADFVPGATDCGSSEPVDSPDASFAVSHSVLNEKDSEETIADEPVAPSYEKLSREKHELNGDSNRENKNSHSLPMDSPASPCCDAEVRLPKAIFSSIEADDLAEYPIEADDLPEFAREPSIVTAHVHPNPSHETSAGSDIVENKHRRSKRHSTPEGEQTAAPVADLAHAQMTAPPLPGSSWTDLQRALVSISESFSRAMRWISDVSDGLAALGRETLAAIGLCAALVVKAVIIICLGVVSTAMCALEESRNSDGALLCFGILYATPMACDLLMSSVSVPQFTPHLLSNLAVYYLCASGTSRRGSATRRQILADDLCRLLLRVIRIGLPVKFIVEGFALDNAGLMMLDEPSRLIVAYTLSMLRRGLILSPVGWLGWATQVILASYLQNTLVLTFTITWMGMAFIQLTTIIQSVSTPSHRS